MVNFPIEEAPAATRLTKGLPPRPTGAVLLADEPIDRLLAHAAQSVAGLEDEFEAVADACIDRLARLLGGTWLPLSTRADAIREFRNACQALGGEAGRFGFDLLGEVAALFDRYLRRTPAAAQKSGDVARYIEAMAVSWKQRIRGDGGSVGRRIIADLSVLSGRAADI